MLISRVPVGKVPPVSRCDQATDEIAADAADRAPDRDVPEHAGRYTFPIVLRLAIAQMRPRKGAYEENLGRLGAVFREVAAAPEPPELIVAPETALTGYFLEGGVRDLAVPRRPACSTT